MGNRILEHMIKPTECSCKIPPSIIQEVATRNQAVLSERNSASEVRWHEVLYAPRRTYQAEPQVGAP